MRGECWKHHRTRPNGGGRVVWLHRGFIRVRTLGERTVFYQALEGPGIQGTAPRTEVGAKIAAPSAIDGTAPTGIVTALASAQAPRHGESAAPAGTGLSSLG